MIIELFKAQLLRLAAAVARDRGTQAVDEHRRIAAVAATVEASVVDLFVAAGMRPEAAEIAARAYALGWADASHLKTNATLSDAVLEHAYADIGEAVRLPSEPRLLN